MDYGEMKSVSGAQDVEKAQEPQRPCDTLDGVTQRQTPHREHGDAEGSGWILDQEPHTAYLAGHPWRHGGGDNNSLGL